MAETASSGARAPTVTALVVMLATQAVVIAAALGPPALGPALTGALGLAPEAIGWFASAVFLGALVASQWAPAVIARAGPVRASQGAALSAALGLGLVSLGTAAGVAAGALLIGLAYAPGNPASSGLLSVTTPARLRGFVFSVKQTAVPIGGVIAGAAPALAAFLDWRAALWALAGLAVAAAIAVEPWRARLDALRLAAPARGRGPLTVVAGDPALRRLAVTAGCLASAQFTTAAVFASFLATDAGVSAPAAGGALAGAMAASVGLRIVLGALADRVGGRRVLTGIAVTALGCAGFCALAAAGMVGAGAVVVGAAAALATSVYSWNGVYLAEVAAVAQPQDVPAATAGAMSFVFLGGLLGPAAFSVAAWAAGWAGGFALVGLYALTAAAALASGPLAQPAAR